MPRWAQWLATGLAGMAAITILTGIWPDSGWPMAALVLCVFFSTLAAASRQLPLQNVLFATVLIAIIGGGISALGTRTGIPFGPFIYRTEASPQLFKTLPWAIPLLWVVVVLNSRGVARLILRPWRKTRTYGFWLMGLTAGLVVAFDLALEPFASFIKRYWLWTPTQFPLTWQGAPLANFLAWGVVTLLMLAFITPLLINKQLSKRSSPDFHPLVIWLGSLAFFGIAAAQHALWPLAVADAVIGLVIAAFAIRGGRW